MWVSNTFVQEVLNLIGDSESWDQRVIIGNLYGHMDDVYIVH